MRPIARVVVVAVLAMPPALTLGEGKCGDDPVKYGPNGTLVVTWGLPIPKDSVVQAADGSVFDRVNLVAGLDVPADFPDRFQQGLQPADLFNSSTVYDSNALVKWEERFGISMGKPALDIFGAHMEKQGDAVQVSLVTHPAAGEGGEAKGFSRCTCTLQRAVAVFDGTKQDLYVRSYFHSGTPDDTSFVNFVPKGGLLVSFKHKSKKIWFPQRLNELLQEPTAYLVLDLLTLRPFNLTKKGVIPDGLKAEYKGRIKLDDNITYHVTRVTGTYSPKKVEDLQIDPP